MTATRRARGMLPGAGVCTTAEAGTHFIGGSEWVQKDKTGSMARASLPLHPRLASAVVYSPAPV